MYKWIMRIMRRCVTHTLPTRSLDAPPPGEPTSPSTRRARRLPGMQIARVHGAPGAAAAAGGGARGAGCGLR